MKAMISFGGGFVKVLGQCAAQADPDNLQRIKSAWPEYWSEYTHIGQNLKEKNDSKK